MKITLNDSLASAAANEQIIQIRKPVKPIPPEHIQIIVEEYVPAKVAEDGEIYPGKPVYGFADEEQGWISPFGKPEDVLWVQEAWQCIAHDEVTPSCNAIWYYTDFSHNVFRKADNKLLPCQYPLPAEHVKAAGSIKTYLARLEWQPPAIMPKWAHRSELIVLQSQVERLQEITYSDAIDSGWHLACGIGADYWYKEEWQRKYKNTEYAWDKNPYVWVGKFQAQIRKPENDTTHSRMDKSK